MCEPPKAGISKQGPLADGSEPHFNALQRGLHKARGRNWGWDLAPPRRRGGTAAARSADCICHYIRRRAQTAEAEQVLIAVLLARALAEIASTWPSSLLFARRRRRLRLLGRRRGGLQRCELIQAIVALGGFIRTNLINERPQRRLVATPLGLGARAVNCLSGGTML